MTKCIPQGAAHRLVQAFGLASGLGKSDSLAKLAANPHTETRQSLEVWSLFWRAKFFPSLHDFVYQALWKKLRVAERLSPWTQDSTCPLCRAVETLDHALGGCLFHKVMTAVLTKVWEQCTSKTNNMKLATSQFATPLEACRALHSGQPLAPTGLFVTHAHP